LEVVTEKEKDNIQLTPQEQKLATKGVPKLLLAYAIPTIIGMLVNALYVVVDKFLIGQIPYIGSYALTGVGFAAPVINISSSFAIMVGIGAAATISIALGNREREKAEQILGNALVLNILFAVVLTIIGFFALEPILVLMGATYETLPFSLEYSRIIMAGIIMLFMSFSMNHPIRATGNPKRFASAQLLGAILNIILSPLFIFVFGWGIAGAAYATLVAQGVTALWVMSFYISMPKIRFFANGSPVKLKKKNLKLKKSIVLAICSIGIAPFFMQVLGSTVIIVANHALLRYGYIEFGSGAAAVGAFTVIGSVSMLFLMPIFGINQGSQPIIGFNYGAKNMDRVKQAYKWAVIYSATITVTGFILVQLFAPLLMQMFVDDALMTEIGSVGMRIILFSMPIAGFQVNSAGLFLAIGRAKVSLFLSVLRQGILLIPLYFLLPRFLGFMGIWYAMPIADTLSAVITFTMVMRELKSLTNNNKLL